MRTPSLPTFKVEMPTDFNSYIELSSGINFTHDSELRKSGASTLFMTGVEGLASSVTLGLANDWGLAAEVEYTYRSGAVDFSVGGSFAEGYLQSHSVMGNAVYYAKTPELVFQPFVGIGAGYLWQEAELANFEGSGSVFSYQAKAGARLQFNEQASASLEYKFQTTSDFDMDFTGPLGTYNLDSATNSTIQLGVQMSF